MNESVKMLEDQARRVAANFDDGAGILEQVLQMRRHEKDFMLRGLESDLEAFRQARTKFINEVNRSVVAPATKAELLKAGEIYWPALDSMSRAAHRRADGEAARHTADPPRHDTNVLVSAADFGKTRANEAAPRRQSETQLCYRHHQPQSSRSAAGRHDPRSLHDPPARRHHRRHAPARRR